jgi:hypothetical protein
VDATLQEEEQLQERGDDGGRGGRGGVDEEINGIAEWRERKEI